jgi:uridine kinase
LVPLRSQLFGIAGGTASGKTTLAQWLAQKLGDRCLLISHDRYYFDVSNPIGHNYDAPQALDNGRLIRNLSELSRGEATELPVYDFATHSRTAKTERVNPHPIVVVEGILVLAIPEIRTLFDYTVFVDAEEGIRLKRRVERDQHTREQILAQYQQTVKPMHDQHVEPSKAGVDLLLRGDGNFEETANALFRAVSNYSGSAGAPD